MEGKQFGLIESLLKEHKTSTGWLWKYYLVSGLLGLILVYFSTKPDGLSIYDNGLFIIGSSLIIVFLIGLMHLSKISEINERQLTNIKVIMEGNEYVKTQFEFRIKIIEYNEKALKFNNKQDSIKLPLIGTKEIQKILEDYFKIVYSKD